MGAVLKIPSMGMVDNLEIAARYFGRVGVLKLFSDIT